MHEPEASVSRMHVLGDTVDRTDAAAAKPKTALWDRVLRRNGGVRLGVFRMQYYSSM
jgi:hypothetical protein